MLVTSRRIDQTLLIGSDIQVTPTDIDPDLVRIIVRGTMLGGPNDGGCFQGVHELSRGQSFWIGSMIQVAVVEIRSDEVRLGVNAPNRLSVQRQEEVDELRRRQRHGEP
jgi:carbon storage regulator CsrA